MHKTADGREDGKLLFVMKGAPERIIARCSKMLMNGVVSHEKANNTDLNWETYCCPHLCVRVRFAGVSRLDFALGLLLNDMTAVMLPHGIVFSPLTSTCPCWLCFASY